MEKHLHYEDVSAYIDYMITFIPHSYTLYLCSSTSNFWRINNNQPLQSYMVYFVTNKFVISFIFGQ